MVDCCLAVRFSDFGKIGHIMAIVTMVMTILSPISNGFR